MTVSSGGVPTPTPQDRYAKGGYSTARIYGGALIFGFPIAVALFLLVPWWLAAEVWLGNALFTAMFARIYQQRGRDEVRRQQSEVSR